MLHGPTMLRVGGWGSAWVPAVQGHHAAAAWSHRCIPAQGSPSQLAASGGSHSTGGQRGVSKLPRPCRSQESPCTSPWRQGNCQPIAQACALQQLSAGHLQLLQPQGLGCAEEPQEIRQQHGMHQGLLRKPRVLSWRGKEQRKWHSHRYHIQSCSVNCPQP